MGERVLLDAADVSRTIARVAHQVIEKTALDSPDAPRVVIIGIPTRGTTLADRLAAKIKEFSGVDVPVGYLDITLYRDDLRAKPHRPLERTMVPAGGVDNAVVVLVDDHDRIDVGRVEQFPRRETENRTVDGGKPLQRPALQMRRHDGIDLCLVVGESLDDRRGVVVDLADALVVAHEFAPFRDELRGADLLGFSLEQQVHRAAAGLVPGSGLLH